MMLNRSDLDQQLAAFRIGDCRLLMTTPADGELGVLAEIFRQRPGTLVNDHAAARFGASGSQAKEILEPIPLHHYYGDGSPLARFADANGLVLRLGADIDTVTLTHRAEYLADIPNKKTVRRRLCRQLGSNRNQNADN